MRFCNGEENGYTERENEKMFSDEATRPETMSREAKMPTNTKYRDRAAERRKRDQESADKDEECEDLAHEYREILDGSNRNSGNFKTVLDMEVVKRRKLEISAEEAKRNSMGTMSDWSRSIIEACMALERRRRNEQTSSSNYELSSRGVVKDVSVRFASPNESIMKCLKALHKKKTSARDSDKQEAPNRIQEEADDDDIFDNIGTDYKVNTEKILMKKSLRNAEKIL